MRSGARPLKLLVTLFFVIVNFTDGGKLEFYQDVESEPPEDIMYKRIARYLESQNREPREMRRSRMSPPLPWQYGEYINYKHQKENKLLEALIDNPSLIDVLESQEMKDREEGVQQWRPIYKNRENYPLNEGERGIGPFVSIDSPPRIFDDYRKINDEYNKDPFNDEKPYYVNAPGYPLRFSPPEGENYPAEEMDAKRLLKFQGKMMEINANRAISEEEKFSSQGSEREPEFTYKFDKPKLNEPNIFAMGPNDPRYYEDDTLTTSVLEEEKTTPERSKVTESSPKIKDPDEGSEDREKIDNDYDESENVRNDKFSLMKVTMPEIHTRAERDPLVVTSSRMTNNDIYFIALVAGCSAACMFALVLLALTWCRLQRGAKAAADIEYPAYGVTGPNKDISPSGDQRLAHSAQMYHFQHQKQQIIAMENRTAASRDPGSVSEAESDEENEEGDYTVYECPGLASTGEMEVKNPMFHDDPTPATPPQNHKEEDHI